VRPDLAPRECNESPASLVVGVLSRGRLHFSDLPKPSQTMHQSGHGHVLGGRPRSMERGVPRKSAKFRNEDGERGTQMDTCTTRTSKVQTLRTDAERGTKFDLFLEKLALPTPAVIPSNVGPRSAVIA
jgi:hypothetical protein